MEHLAVAAGCRLSQAETVVVGRMRVNLTERFAKAGVDPISPDRRGQGKKRRGHRQRAWPKLATVLHTRSHLMLAAVPGLGPSQDSPDFTPAMRQAAAHIAFKTVLGDAGYDAEHNHRLCREELGVARTPIRLNRRNTGRRRPRTHYRRAMRHRFPKPLYHQRWHVESAFSQNKRRLGSDLTARRPASQNRKILLRVLTHNIMLLPQKNP